MGLNEASGGQSQPASAERHLEGEEIVWADSADLVGAYRSGRLSPVEVADAVLARIGRLEPQINAFVHLDRDTTLAMARASERRWRAGEPLGALDGVPITVKDLLPVQGWPLRRGSLAYDPDVPAPEDAPCVARLREAGTVFLGKTATPDSGCKIVTQSDVHGETRNPYDLTKTPGGSSGAAAAALATGLGPLAVGTDGAGSIRIPAAFCNLVGLKPSFGRVPIHPTSLFMPHSVVGPMGRRVRDVALMLDVMARPDPRDPYAWPIRFDLDKALDEDLSGLRVAASSRLGFSAPLLDREAVDTCRGIAGVFAEAGAAVEQVEPVWPVDPLEPFEVFWEATYAGYLAIFTVEQQRRMDQDLQAIAARGRDVDIVKYHKALEQRGLLASAAKSFFSKYDLLIGPVMPVPPYGLGRLAPPGAEGEWDWCPFTYPWNMTGQPAASVPCGFTATGLPIGLQVIAWTGNEETILRAAAVLERARPLYRRHP